MSSRCLVALLPCLGLIFAPSLEAAEFTSHAPVRPLPQASARALSNGPAKFVDAKSGDDANDGSEQKPWKTLGHSVTKLQPGDTLYLRGGVYYDHVTTTLRGEAGKPITIRAYPNELVTLDGGLPEFQLDHANAWEPDPDGVAGEFRSTKTYPGQGAATGDLKIGALGLFVDSHLPLHGYWHHPDLQSDNPYWTLGGGEKTKPDAHVYCGPGLWFNPATQRIHCRLAHTKLPGLHENNYTGETDPRKIPLVVATFGAGAPLKLVDCRYVILQDLVIRGARTDTLNIDGGANLELDGLTLYGGGACLRAPGVHGLRVANTACRGLAGPWTFRGSLKYRSLESRLIRTSGWDPTGDDGVNYEFANCEFTDSVDGVFIGNIRRVSFHHNLVENVSDDAVFVTSNTAYDGTTPGGESWFYRNRFARNLTCFAFGVGHGRQKAISDGATNNTTKRQLGGGIWISRNVFDFRRSVMYHWPTGPDDEQELLSLGRFAGDHGSPAREPMEIVHNTILAGDTPRYEYGTDGFSGAMQQGTRRRVYNNLICQLKGLPGDYLPPGDTDYDANGNLLWSVDPEAAAATVVWKPRYLKDKTPPKPDWAGHDKFADPKFVQYDGDWRKPVDLRLRDGSPAIDAGTAAMDVQPGRGVLFTLKEDAGAPDVGAIPKGSDLPRIGVFGRFDICGNAVEPEPNASIGWQLPQLPATELPPVVEKPAIVVTGYPAFDAPLVMYALRRSKVPVVELERQWLDPEDYKKYSTIIYDGSFTRGKVVPDKFSSADLVHVKKFLENGGTLWLCRDRQDLFADREPKIFLFEVTGGYTGDKSVDQAVLKPEHPWIQGFTASTEMPWLPQHSKTLSIKKGEVIVGTPSGNAVLGRVPVGKGQIIYLGFSPSAALPGGREKVTVEEERKFTEQMRVLSNIVETLYPKK